MMHIIQSILYTEVFNATNQTATSLYRNIHSSRRTFPSVYRNFKSNIPFFIYNVAVFSNANQTQSHLYT